MNRELPCCRRRGAGIFSTCTGAPLLGCCTPARGDCVHLGGCRNGRDRHAFARSGAFFVPGRTAWRAARSRLYRAAGRAAPARGVSECARLYSACDSAGRARDDGRGSEPHGSRGLDGFGAGRLCDPQRTLHTYLGGRSLDGCGLCDAALGGKRDRARRESLCACHDRPGAGAGASADARYVRHALRTEGAA